MARIVHVSATLATGIYTIICTLAKCQLKAGHEVFLVGCTRPEDSVSTWREDLPSGVTLIDLPMEREIDFKKDLAAAKELRKILKSLRPNVVHLHSSKAGAIGRLAALFLGAKVVYQPNGFSFLRRDISKMKFLTFGMMESALALLPGRIVASSAGERASARSFIFFRKLDLVHNSIELPESIHRFRSSRNQLEKINVGTCGRVSPQKDPGYFSEVVKYFNGNVNFTWIGGGNFPQGHEQLKMAGAKVTGVVSREDAMKYIADLDVYIQTSAWEGMPISVLEAMALGVPVVVRDVVGNRDLLEVVAPDLIVTTPKQMAEKIQELNQDAQRQSEICLALKSYVIAEFSPETQGKAFERLYGI